MAIATKSPRIRSKPVKGKPKARALKLSKLPPQPKGDKPGQLYDVIVYAASKLPRVAEKKVDWHKAAGYASAYNARGTGRKTDIVHAGHARDVMVFTPEQIATLASIAKELSVKERYNDETGAHMPGIDVEWLPAKDTYPGDTEDFARTFCVELDLPADIIIRRITGVTKEEVANNLADLLEHQAGILERFARAYRFRAERFRVAK